MTITVLDMSCGSGGERLVGVVLVCFGLEYNIVVCAVNVCHSIFFFFLMIRRPPRSTQSRSSAASDVYKRQGTANGLFKMDILTEKIVKIEILHPEFKNKDISSIVRGIAIDNFKNAWITICLLYTSPSPRDS